MQYFYKTLKLLMDVPKVSNVKEDAILLTSSIFFIPHNILSYDMLYEVIRELYGFLVFQEILHTIF